MDSEFNANSNGKSSMLPVLVGGVGVAFGLLGIVFGYSAKSKANKLDERVASLEMTLSDAKKVRESVETMDGRISGLANANNALAMQVNDQDRKIRSLFDQTQAALSSLSEQISKAQSAPARRSAEKADGDAKGDKAAAGDKTAAAADGSYVVQKGDTFGVIAKKLGVKVADLEAANPGVDSRSLKVGQKLRAPKK